MHLIDCLCLIEVMMQIVLQKLQCKKCKSWFCSSGIRVIAKVQGSSASPFRIELPRVFFCGCFSCWFPLCQNQRGGHSASLPPPWLGVAHLCLKSWPSIDHFSLHMNSLIKIVPWSIRWDAQPFRDRFIRVQEPSLASACHCSRLTPLRSDYWCVGQIPHLICLS